MALSRMLRPLFFLVCAMIAVARADATGRAATPDEAALLNELLHTTANDLRRWAYTEHRVMRDHEGKVKSDHLVRYDPSKPYAEQWTPIKINGKDPSERDVARYRRRGEQSPEAKQGPVPGVQVGGRDSKRVALGEVIDVPRASIASETATHLVYEIPLRKIGNERFPPEKFIVHARVRKEGKMLENVSAKLRESFRSKLVVKVKSGEGSIDFAQVDPQHPPTMVKVAGDAAASVLFFNVGGSMDLTRTDLKRVRPFDERFEVQIGNLKAIDF